MILPFLYWVLPGVSEGGFFFHASTEIINVLCNGSSSFIKEVGRFELLPPLEIQLAASARHTPPPRHTVGHNKQECKETSESNV